MKVIALKSLQENYSPPSLQGLWIAVGRLNMVYMITSLDTKVDSSTNYVINFIHKTILQRAIRTMLLKKINQSSSTHRNNHLSLLPLLSKTTSITTKQLSVEEDGAYLHSSLKGD